ncbi:hypothetical protein H2200_004526 [Cladophialophora chaetospira]|uniref:RING-type E3 ubiquitin transferase n=1 Tax=Cladophialophora chaetospira TaxID=386627 RepID=A0AA39CJK0_9EURO|nr:hypothetical protein H2200_004526 [Cladophialophora chaetospira]
MATSVHNETTPNTRDPVGSAAILSPSRIPTIPPSRECCVICLDQITDKATALPCRHDQFDFSCLGTWLQRQQVCPLCKTAVAAIRFKVGGETESKTQVLYLPPPEEPQAIQDERGGTPTYLQQHGARRRAHGRRGHYRAPRCVRPEVSKDAALDFRRNVYRHKLYSLHVGSNRISRYRNLTPDSFANDEQLTTRARIFIRRELQIFDFLNPNSARTSGGSISNDRRANNADFLLEYIIGILRSIDLKGSTGQAEELLKDFLGRENARVFLHELEAWLRSPYEHLKDWDRAVQYAVSSEEGERNESPSSSRTLNVCRRSSQTRSHEGVPAVPRWFSDNFVLNDEHTRRSRA